MLHCWDREKGGRQTETGGGGGGEGQSCGEWTLLHPFSQPADQATSQGVNQPAQRQTARRSQSVVSQCTAVCQSVMLQHYCSASLSLSLSHCLCPPLFSSSSSIPPVRSIPQSFFSPLPHFLLFHTHILSHSTPPPAPLVASASFHPNFPPPFPCLSCTPPLSLLWSALTKNFWLILAILSLSSSQFPTKSSSPHLI